MDFWAYVALALIGWAVVLCVIGYVADWRRKRDPRHSCDLPCVGKPGHYGVCCCDQAHTWKDRRHGMRCPTT